MGKRTTRLLTVAAMAAAFLAGGCTIQDAICGGDDYPVKLIGSTTGGDCVPEGEEPPAGYVRYPAGKVPKHVDDEWDKYWSDRALDAQGNEIAG